MDFSLGDIIFFGAIIIAIVSNIAKHLKKGKQTPQREPATVPLPTEVVDYFQKIKKQKEAPVQQKSTIISPQHDTTEKQIEEPILEEPVAEENDFVLNFSDASELKKGIIYTEIFNRRY